MGTLKNLSTDVIFVKKDLNGNNSLNVIVKLTIRNYLTHTISNSFVRCRLQLNAPMLLVSEITDSVLLITLKTLIYEYECAMS